MRRTTVILIALNVRLGRYRVCRLGLSGEVLRAHVVWLAQHSFIRLRDTAFTVATEEVTRLGD